MKDVFLKATKRALTWFICTPKNACWVLCVQGMQYQQRESNFLLRGENGKEFFLCQILPHSV